MADSTAALRKPIVVVGAGLAGLACATMLSAAGREVIVLEASDEVGGRVRTDRHPDGYLLDRGFQILLDAYPSLKRHADLAGLQLGAFDAGAMLWTGNELVPLADPFRHPSAIVRDVTTNVIGMVDKVRLAVLAARIRAESWRSAAEASVGLAEDISAADALRDAGFSGAFLDSFARPFWGGITYDGTLEHISAHVMRYTFKMFLAGYAVLPAEGMVALPRQMAAHLPAGAVRCNTPVQEIVQAAGRATGVIAGSERIEADAVVVATDPLTAKRLTGVAAIPDVGVGGVTVHLIGERDPAVGKWLVIDATRSNAVNHIGALSAAQPTYAPPGRHLLAAVIVNQAAVDDPDDEKLMRAAQGDVARMLGHEPGDWTPINLHRNPFSQFAQPPGIHATLPEERTGTPGLYLASEATVDSSQNGALISGERAAVAVLDDLRAAPPQ